MKLNELVTTKLQPKVLKDGTKKWYKGNNLHREDDKPAVEYANGTKYWHKNGIAYNPNNS